MSEEELIRIQRLKEKDAEDAVNAMLDSQINDAEHNLTILQNKRLKLTETLATLKVKMEEVEVENDRLSETFKEPPMNDDQRGSFFDQLRNLEAIQEQYRGQIQGLKAVNYSLTSEINKTQNQVKILAQNIAELQEQSANADADRIHRIGDLSQSRNKLNELDEQLELVTRECIDIKAAIKRKADNLKSMSVESVANLISQKQALENELRNKKEKLEKKKKKEGDYTIKSSADEKIRQRLQDIKMSPNAWMSQRLSLVAKIKRAKEELELLDSRQRGVNKSNTRVDSIKDNMKWTDDTAKWAIACEIAELQKEPPKFLGNALATELNFKKEMEAQLADIERTSNQITQFKETTMELMHEQEITAGKAEKLALLKKELSELRSKI